MLTISTHKKKNYSLSSAEVDSLGGESDHDEPPDGQGQGQPDGDGVDHDAEVCMEEEKDGPGVRKLKLISKSG